MTTAQAPYRELTVAGVVLGVLIGICLTSAFVYISLKLGFGLAGSTVAAILGFAVLRGGLKRGSIVENNINQTVASGINTASSGVTFTLPALYLMSVNDPSLAGFKLWPILLAATAGSFLGIVLIIPLRKQMIEFERLRFPSGIAVASLLKSPGAGREQAYLLLGGFLVAALFHSGISLELFGDEISFNGLLGLPAYVPLAFGISFASLGAGLLSGKGGLPFVGGGVLAWWLIAPVAVSMGWVPSPADAGLDPGAGYDGWLAGTIYGTMLRPLGIGILIGGAIAGVIASFPAMKAAIAGLSSAAKTQGVGSEHSPQELPAKVLYFGLAAAVLVLFMAAHYATDDVSWLQAAGIAGVGTLWLAIAGLIVAQATGMTDISPLSGMALIAVTLMFFMTQGNVVASVMLGVAVCIGIGQCGDMMSDLKSGHLIGATPRAQQIAQFMVAWIGPPIAIAVVYLLWTAGEGGMGGFGPGQELSAPQAGALQAIIESLQSGNSAVDKYAAGAAIGLGLGLYPLGGLGVLVGLAMYLPLYITLTYGAGCLLSIGFEKAKGARWMGAKMVPLAAGFIVGEALTSLTFVLIKLVTG